MAKPPGQDAGEREKTAPAPDDSRKPQSPTDITPRSWMYVLKKTLREFVSDQCTDLAASLTYYGTLAVFPALLAFVSLLGIFGNARTTTNSLISLAQGVVPASTLSALRQPIDSLTHSPAAGVTLAVGIIGALWSASGYVTAFSRAMNRVYGIREGRPIWKLRPVMLGITVMAIIFAVIAAFLLVLSGPVLDKVGSNLGLGHGVLIAWNIIKWPILLVMAIGILAVLYYATPNVKQPKFRWTSLGSVVALVVWAVASGLFALYAANFSKYNATYGAIGGVIVFLLWIWISNNALLFGAELDAEIERGRELQAGIAAEEDIQLPPRDTRQSDKAAEKHAKDVRDARSLRLSHGEDSGPKDSGPKDSGPKDNSPKKQRP